MKRFKYALTITGSLFYLCGSAALAESTAKSPIPGMSQEQLIKLAMSAAPSHISKDATIMIPDKDGKLVEAKKGTNGFTCLPDTDGQEKPTPICADAASMQWVDAYVNGAAKPENTAPGIAYMGQGGWHWEKNGKIVMHNNADDMKGAKRVSEPPHWMLLWPFDSKDSGIPTMPDKWRTYVMFEGTPFAHLMIYQNPMNMK